MATNFKQPGDVIPFTAGADLSSGGVVKIGVVIGIVQAAVANGATGQAAIRGVFSAVPKATGAAWTEGAKLYWDASASKFTTTSTSNTACGYAAAAAASGDATGDILLAPVA